MGHIVSRRWPSSMVLIDNLERPIHASLADNSIDPRMTMDMVTKRFLIPLTQYDGR